MREPQGWPPTVRQYIALATLARAVVPMHGCPL